MQPRPSGPHLRPSRARPGTEEWETEERERKGEKGESRARPSMGEGEMGEREDHACMYDVCVLIEAYISICTESIKCLSLIVQT